ncbi:MAG: hypothetical protein R3183_08425 [Oleiphilaceae bacterium]|nr:hypothetical protein [Oleiphilaceae bacterium]
MTGLFVFIVILLLIGGGIWGWPLLAAALGLSNVNDKQGALKSIAQLMHTYDITPAEIEQAYQSEGSDPADSNHRNKSAAVKTLFAYLGVIFITAGITTYIAMFWNSMGSAMRIGVTLGVGYALLVVLVSALHESRFPKLVFPLTLACAFVMTGGWFVLFDELLPQLSHWRTLTLSVFSIMLVHQGALFFRYRHTILLFVTLCFFYAVCDLALDMLGVPVAYIAIVLGASLFLVGAALDRTPYRVLTEPALLIGTLWFNAGLFDQVTMLSSTSWACTLVGLSLMSAAYGLQRKEHYPRLIGLGYFAGSMMAYGGAFDLLQDTPIELAYLALTLSALYFCVVLKTRALLVTTVLAMLSYIGYFSEQHFADSLGWPITLVLMGILFLAIGLIALKVKRLM